MGGWAGWQVATAPRAPAWDLRIHNHAYLLLCRLVKKWSYVWVFSDAKVATKNTDIALFPPTVLFVTALHYAKIFYSVNDHQVDNGRE